MAKVGPYHSTHYEAPHVYHDHDDCPPGSQIPPRYRANGRGEHRHCTKCAELDAATG